MLSNGAPSKAVKNPAVTAETVAVGIYEAIKDKNDLIGLMIGAVIKSSIYPAKRVCS
jgi:hypothetical protein